MTPTQEQIEQMHARMLAEVVHICERLGYGYVIQQAAQEWAKKDPTAKAIVSDILAHLP